jgi:hypothetical protein
MLAVAEEALTHPNVELVANLLWEGGAHVGDRVSDEALLGMAERGSVGHKAQCLDWFVRRDTVRGNSMSAAHSGALRGARRRRGALDRSHAGRQGGGRH